ncbi:MAG: hypothetical protein ACYTBP_09400 [Planctomycetota bacterium]
MRLITLIRKELRESLPWLLLAAIVLAGIGAYVLRMEIVYKTNIWRYNHVEQGKITNSWYLFKYSHLSVIGAWLFILSITLGLVLAVVQFWMHFFTRTWGFTLHRSAGRGQILVSKLAAGVISFILSLGLVWTLLYLYSIQSGLFFGPPSLRTFIEGWIFILLGFIVYLGTALMSLSRARWYTTRIFPLVFAGLVLIIVCTQWRLITAFAVIIIFVVILLSQVTERFLNREF